MPTIGYTEKGKDWTKYLHGPAFVSICVHVCLFYDFTYTRAGLISCTALYITHETNVTEYVGT